MDGGTIYGDGKISKEKCVFGGEREKERDGDKRREGELSLCCS